MGQERQHPDAEKYKIFYVAQEEFQRMSAYHRAQSREVHHVTEDEEYCCDLLGLGPDKLQGAMSLDPQP